MARFCRVPAAAWRAFFLGAILAAVPTLPAGPAPTTRPPDLAQFGAPDPAEGRKALEQMRRQGVAGNYYLEFQLRVMPRRGEERRIAARLWGGRNDEGPLTRVSLGAGADERRLLIQNGPRSAVWRWSAGDRRVDLLGVRALFEPVMPGADITAFDLQMPFLYWDDFSYEGLARFRGRPAHVIVLRPPPEFAAQHPALAGVRVHLDTQFNALVQTELLGPGGAVTKTLSLVDLKKVGEQWIPRTFDIRDEATRNKTRFDVSAAALGLEFSRLLFEPAQLDDDIRPPAAALVRFGP
jgi:hypothetical protein